MLLTLKNKISNFIKKNGWKAAVAIFMFYLVRDVALYILLPWMIARNVF